jgi:hypothetical protein
MTNNETVFTSTARPDTRAWGIIYEVYANGGLIGRRLTRRGGFKYAVVARSESGGNFKVVAFSNKPGIKRNLIDAQDIELAQRKTT